MEEEKRGEIDADICAIIALIENTMMINKK